MRKQRQRGFTIIEALIAIVILVGVMLAMVGLVPSTFTDASRDSQRMEAASAAQEYLDALRYYVKSNGTNVGLPTPAPVKIDEGDQYMGANNPMPSPSPGNFALTNNGCPFVAGSNRMYDCQVTATWTVSGSTRSIQVESYVTSEN